MFFSDKQNQDSGSKNTLFNWILIVLAIIQGSSQLLEIFFFNNQTASPSLPNMWISVGKEISKNWFAFSISLILLVLGYFLYKRICGFINWKNRGTKKEWVNTLLLLLINLSLCNKVYSSDSISKKINEISNHIPTAIVVVIISVLGILTALLIRSHAKVSEELKDVSNLESKDSTEAKKEWHDREFNDDELKFRMRHPFSYAFRSFANYLTDKRKLKQEYKKEKIQTKISVEQEKRGEIVKSISKGNYKHEYELSNKGGIASAVVSLVVSCLLVYCFCFSDGNNIITPTINKVVQKLTDITETMINAEEPLMTFLTSAGLLFLFVVTFLTIFLLLYLSIRVVLYLVLSAGEDSERICRCGQLVKIFVLNAIDSALRPLLFIPDFLEHVEIAILGTDLDQKIQEFYPQKGNPGSNPGSNPGGNPGGNPGASKGKNEDEDQDKN